jgi:WD40 repeat protein
MYTTVAGLALVALAAEPERPAKVIECSGPRGRVSKPVFSPDGRWVAAMAYDEEIAAVGGKKSLVNKGHDLLIWDARTGKVVVNVPHGPEAWSGHTPIAFTPDGKALVASRSGSPPTKVVSIEVPGGAVTNHAGVPPGPANYHFSADRTVVLTRTVRNLDLYEVSVWPVQAEGKPLLKASYEKRQVGGVGLSADGKVAMTLVNPLRKDDVRWAEKELVIWDVPTGKARPAIVGKVVEIHSDTVLSPDGKTVAGYERTVDALDGQLTLWDTGTGRARPLSVEPLKALVFTADSTTLVGVLGTNKVGIVDVAKGKLTRTVSTPFPYVRFIAVSPDGKRVVVVGGELNDFRGVRILDLE